MCNVAQLTYVPRFKNRPGVRLFSTKELFQIIPMYMINREIIPGRKEGCSTVSSVTISDTLITSVNSSRVLSHDGVGSS